MAPVPEDGGGVLRVTPDELRDAARAFDAAGRWMPSRFGAFVAVRAVPTDSRRRAAESH